MSAARDLFHADAAPVSPVDVATIRAAVDRERRALAAAGRFGAEAECQAVAITRAKLANAADLADLQVNPGRCHFCGEVLDDTRPVVAVLAGRPRAPLWLHGGACHIAHSRRHLDRVAGFMARGGFGLGPDVPKPDQEHPTP